MVSSWVLRHCAMAVVLPMVLRLLFRGMTVWSSPPTSRGSWGFYAFIMDVLEDSFYCEFLYHSLGTYEYMDPFSVAMLFLHSALVCEVGKLVVIYDSAVMRLEPFQVISVADTDPIRWALLRCGFASSWKSTPLFCGASTGWGSAFGYEIFVMPLRRPFVIPPNGHSGMVGSAYHLSILRRQLWSFMWHLQSKTHRYQLVIPLRRRHQGSPDNRALNSGADASMWDFHCMHSCIWSHSFDYV